MKKTTVFVSSCIAGLSLLMAGCSNKASYDGYEKVPLSASWSYNYGSVEELTKSGDIVAIVKITDSKSEPYGGMQFTIYDAEIKQLICGNDEKKIKIYMTGGVDENEKKIYEIEDDPLMQINDEFLIFATQNKDGTYTILSGSQGRFEIKDDRVYSLNESNVQVKKASVGSNIKVNGKDKDKFISDVKSYAS